MNPRLPRIASLVLVLLVALVPAAFAGRSASVSDLLPRSTVGLVSIDLRAFAKSSHYPAIRQALLQKPEVANVLNDLSRAGVELERDVLRITLAAPTGFDDMSDFAIFVEGRNLLPRILPLIEERVDKLAPARHGGVTYWKLKGQGTLAEVGGLIIVADEARMKMIIDQRRDRSKSLRRDKRAHELMARVGAHQVWMTIRPDPKSRSAVPGLERLVTVGVGMSLSEGLALEMVLDHLDSTAAAKSLAMVAVMKSMVAGNSTVQSLGIDSALQGAKASQDGNLVTVAVELSKAELLALKPALRSIQGIP